MPPERARRIAELANRDIFIEVGAEQSCAYGSGLSVSFPEPRTGDRSVQA